uniref:IF rod domain-containing protein n=1 Tax=Eptatretus burgeri TaxID=7764 RepID=A0A8C4QHR8_EPTBU
MASSRSSTLRPTPLGSFRGRSTSSTSLSDSPTCLSSEERGVRTSMSDESRSPSRLSTSSDAETFNNNSNTNTMTSRSSTATPVSPFGPGAFGFPASLMNFPGVSLGLRRHGHGHGHGPNVVPSQHVGRDMGKDLHTMKLLNIRLRCFLVKVHELERKNRLLETEVRTLRGRFGLPLGPTSASSEESSMGEFGEGLGSLLWRLGGIGERPHHQGPASQGVGVQVDTVGPEVRALYNVLAMVRRERDQYRARFEEEQVRSKELQDTVTRLNEQWAELDSRIQEKARRVDMDICRRIELTAKLCDIAQHCGDGNALAKLTSPRRDGRHSSDAEDVADLHSGKAGGGAVGGRHVDGISETSEEEAMSGNLTDEVKKMWHQIREVADFDSDSDSLTWEEMDNTLLLWDDLPTSNVPNNENLCAPAKDEGWTDSVENVILETETLFQRREKEYQETISEIELELQNAKNDMTRHLHEYMEMCSMKRGLDVQMESCTSLMSHSTARSPCVSPMSSPSPEPDQEAAVQPSTAEES